MSFEEILRNLENIPDFSDIEEKRVFQEIRTTAKADKETFIRFVRDLPVADAKRDPDRMNLLNLSALYEVLAPDIQYWESFYLEEIDRLTVEAERSASPGKVLEPLESYVFIVEYCSDSQQNIFIQRFGRYLSSNIPQIRFMHIGFIGDFLADKNSREFGKIEEISLTDTDWRVRYICHDVITHLGGSDQTKLRVLDRLRGKLFAGYRYD